MSMLGMLILSSGAYAQSGPTITVSGNVKDNLNEPVISASVYVKGTINAVATDLDGNYVINDVPSDGTLVYSFIGLKTVEMPVNGQTTINVTMEEDAALLSEVIVIGYGTVRREDMTGAVTAIKAEELNRGAVTSPQQLMQGKVAGLFVQPGSGQPGAGSTIRIRSGASLNATNDPLIVIDGVPISNDAAPGMANGLATVNPNDIETMTILKDASATAIFGSRASNGVIIITTKKGVGDKLRVSYNMTVSMNDPYEKLKVLNGSEYRDIFTQTFGTDATAMALLNMYPNQSTDWQDLIYRTSFSTDHNLSVSGNAANTPFRLSFGYNSDAGTLQNSNFERFTLDGSVSRKFFDDHLNISLNVKGMINNNVFADGGAVGSAAFYDPTKPAYNTDGQYNGYWNWNTATGLPNTLSANNPLGLLYDARDRGTTKRSIGNVQLDYKLHFLPELRANLNLGYDIARGKGSEKGPFVNSFMTAKDTEFPNIGQLSDWNNFRRNQLMDFYLNYDKEFEKIESRLNVMAGYSWQHFYQADRTTAYTNSNPAWGTSPGEREGWIYNPGGFNYLRQNTGVRIPKEYYLISFFGRLNYTFKNRYLLTATLRRDGSSRFSKDNRWGMFPSAALAWTISQEEFMKDFTALSNLKLRLSYGETGQQDIGADMYAYIPDYLLSTNPSSIYLGNYLLKPMQYNRNLKWETTKTYNIGLDFGFLGNRINGSIEAYKKKTSDLLSFTDVAAGTNFANQMFANIGNMENKGVEFNINATAIDTKDFSWSPNFNITWNDSKITNLTAGDNPDFPGLDVGGGIPVGTGGNISKHMVGYAPFAYYVYQQVYGEDGKPLQNVYVDRNNDGQITSDDRYFYKNPMPKWYLGFGSQFRYKNFDLGFNLRANFGNYVYNAVAAGNSTVSNAYGAQGFLTNLHSTIYDTGFTGSNSVEQASSDYFIENASFLKMDNITLGYSFDKLGGDNISGRISFSVQNVFTITDYSGLDPEVPGADGTDNNIWPRPRVYTLGLSLNF